jgi:hypothetical protein
MADRHHHAACKSKHFINDIAPIVFKKKNREANDYNKINTINIMFFS